MPSWTVLSIKLRPKRSRSLTALPGVDPKILDPRDTYANASEWETKAKDLSERFIKNFKKFEGNAAGKALVAAGPRL